MTNKMTYVQALDVAISMTEGEVAEKLTALRAQVAKRNSGERKPTKVQVENQAIRERILEILADKHTATEVAEVLGLTNQKVTALITSLVRAELVERTVEKGKAYFKAVEVA